MGKYDLVICADIPMTKAAEINGITRKCNKAFICCEQSGLIAYIFDDFGPNFSFEQSNGEHPTELRVDTIELIDSKQNIYKISIGKEAIDLFYFDFDSHVTFQRKWSSKSEDVNDTDNLLDIPKGVFLIENIDREKGTFNIKLDSAQNLSPFQGAAYVSCVPQKETIKHVIKYCAY